MRHRRKTVKLGRKAQHRDAMLANMAGSLIQHNRIKTTLAKAKALRPFAEKLVTLGKKGTLHHRRMALAKLKSASPRKEGAKNAKVDVVHKLFAEIAPRFKDREGGYTRILKIGYRGTDASKMALIEWVDSVSAPSTETEKTESKKKETPETTAKETKTKASKPKKSASKAKASKEEVVDAEVVEEKSDKK